MKEPEGTIATIDVDCLRCEHPRAWLVQSVGYSSIGFGTNSVILVKKIAEYSVVCTGCMHEGPASLVHVER